MNYPYGSNIPLDLKDKIVIEIIVIILSKEMF